MKHLPVLIVGAGPAGLMMACELKRHGIPFRIIDKKLEPAQGSNATWIQARTLEIFNAIGIVDRFLKIGHKCEAINFYVKGKALANLPLTQIDSTYPFILMLPQCETERLLTKKLEESKIRVERSVELIAIAQKNNEVISTVALANGDTETITSDFVIACDGANSTIREKCQIPFPGEDLPEQFMVADAQMSSFLPDNEIHVFFDKGTTFPDKGTIFSAFPWGSRNYRLTANLYQEGARQTFYEHEVREAVSERTYGNYTVESVSWISPFWIHGKMVNQMRNGSVFLAGDAAHIHSPASGQGMNLGIQDAFNLAWKLALVIKGKSNQSLLDSYQEERYPIINGIVKQADYLTNMALFDKSFINKLRKFSKEISDHPRSPKEICEQLSQINIHYKNSPIINYKEKPNEESPQQGERAPNVKINDSKTLYSYFNSSYHTILLFTGNRLTNEDLTTIKKLENLLKEKFSDFVKMLVVAKERSNDIHNMIPDVEDVVHQHYKITHPVTYIIRPDNYIGYYANGIDFLSIDEFLQQIIQIN